MNKTEQFLLQMLKALSRKGNAYQRYHRQINRLRRAHLNKTEK